MSKLVIVESPAKAKTIGKYLGGKYDVVASMGHVRDLPASKLGIDVDRNFEPEYVNIKGKEKLIRSLKSAAKSHDGVYLATDPDREGEAISWHLAHLLGLDVESIDRVTFNEITKKGIQDGMAHPRAIDQDLVNAQQARRVLDRLVGYKLSPFLWRKVRRGLSAGRVQSVAVRLIADRQKAIDAFVPEEYWNINATLTAPGSSKQFVATLAENDRGEKIAIRNKDESDRILRDLEGKPFIVSELRTGLRHKSPAPPFITSTLQQEASRRFGFSATRTMRAAQTLYEGVDIAGIGMTGLITYMRTDSLRLSDEAVEGARSVITGKWGDEYASKVRRVYKKKGAGQVQDAHEAIRPTNPAMLPDDVDKNISGDTAKLYRLIWNRFMASQMADAVYDTVSAGIGAGGYLFRASGYHVKFDGFTALYEEMTDEKNKKEIALPPLKKDMILNLVSLGGEQKFTQPPFYYTEASLIKALEENGIGRPSTYAPIITTIIDRGYVERQSKQLRPTPLGMTVNDLMQKEFPDIVNIRFSADMEKNLDKVEDGKADWVKTVDEFYRGFDSSLQKAEKDLEGKKVKVPDIETDEICELCGRKMVIKTGRYGKFLACSGFPECKNTRRLVQAAPGECPLCGGKILVKRSKKGRVYYGCEKNPACGFMSWDEPTDEHCPTCGKTLFRHGGKSGRLICVTPGCGFTKPLKP